MCGIAGMAHWGGWPDAPQRTRAMAAALRHRGPDGEDAWSDADVALGHTRLNILDFAGGGQPMPNEDGTVLVVYNGEIYNHRELRTELVKLGHVFRSDHSDTEVLVHGYESWGEGLPGRLNGMFAFALWDRRSRALFLARDRYGIKPLYLAPRPEGRIVFASEVRGILASGIAPRRDSPRAILEYLSFQNLWGEFTLFDGIVQFPAGHWARYGPEGSVRRRFWDFTFPRSFRGTMEDAAARHREILRRVVARQIEADVPVVTYLSGGIDSTAVAAAAVEHRRETCAYTCLFDLNGVAEDRAVDEREFARAAARHLGVRHVEMELPQDTLRENLDRTIAALEYPRMGMSYANYLIAGRVARDFRVVLSGIGGDEIHGGYVSRYQALRPPLGVVDRIRRAVRSAVRGTSGDPLATYLALLNFPIPEAELVSALTPEFLASAGAFAPREAVCALLDACPSADPWDRLMYVDAKAYLHGLLVLEDKLSMAHSLETRVPLLDNELVDFVLDLPWPMLCDGSTGKIVFRRSVRPWMPDVIVEKPKMGFGPPDASWYRGALRGWIAQELAEKNIRSRGIFQPAYVRRTLDEHFSGRHNHVTRIWTLLSLESWFRGSARLVGGSERA